MDSALEMFEKIVDDTEQFENRRETPWASVGHFIRETVKYIDLLILDILDDKLKPVKNLWFHNMFPLLGCFVSLFRQNSEQQRGGKVKMKPPGSCCCVQSAPC